jgi:hypothetical protein
MKISNSSLKMYSYCKQSSNYNYKLPNVDQMQALEPKRRPK